MTDNKQTPEDLLKFSNTLTIIFLVAGVFIFTMSKIYETELSGWFWFCVFFFIVGLIGSSTFQKQIKQEKKENSNFSKIKNSGYNREKFILLQKYMGGIPEFDRTGITFKLYPTPAGFDVFNTSYQKLGEIKNSEIMDVIVEDKREVEKRLSVTNIALFGVLGLAMRKSKELDVSLVVLKLNDGRFSHDGIFSFEYTKENKLYDKTLNSYKEAMNARNSIISHLKSL